MAEYRQKPSQGRIFILSGPSGAGKTLLSRKILTLFPDMLLSVSYTTRKQRPQEVDGRDYFFLTPEDFQRKIDQGDFLEWAIVHGQKYGTCRKWVTEKLNQGHDVILEIDVQGAEQVQRQNLPACSIFVAPPSMEILLRRLKGRKNEAEMDIAKRLKNAEAEIQKAPDYQYLIINDVLSEAVEQLASIIRAQRCRL
ncbi:MAG: guanylate kinase [Candidatus Schekmanbacteria bacterium]|nr:guanylate kinase [Candidatus Schekmanbacteria bacterium]